MKNTSSHGVDGSAQRCELSTSCPAFVPPAHRQQWQFQLTISIRRVSVPSNNPSKISSRDNGVAAIAGPCTALFAQVSYLSLLGSTLLQQTTYIHRCARVAQGTPIQRQTVAPAATARVPPSSPFRCRHRHCHRCNTHSISSSRNDNGSCSCKRGTPFHRCLPSLYILHQPGSLRRAG